jgi:hypothetical protein
VLNMFIFYGKDAGSKYIPRVSSNIGGMKRGS